MNIKIMFLAYNLMIIIFNILLIKLLLIILNCMKKSVFFVLVLFVIANISFAQNSEYSQQLINRFNSAKKAAVSPDAIIHNHLVVINVARSQIKLE